MDEELKHILRLRFYVGSIQGLLTRTLRGGLIVVPSAPVLVDLEDDEAHREALEGSDFAITDSGFFVLLWFLFKGERLPRISGLRYLRALVAFPEFRKAGATYWVMPSEEDSRANVEWLSRQGIVVGPDDCYLAPMYPGGRLQDGELLARLERKRPKFVVLCIGGGAQERLGFFLTSHLSYRPAIICTGAAIAFLSGRQVRIPVWADRLMLGWFLRILSSPVKFIPRFWKALRLAPIVLRAETRRP
jgi:UDP-N-acetyl-D-mannosaminuronic acid transferase (WecB/TagA/CpsF family)